jgi:hypothetical protein
MRLNIYLCCHVVITFGLINYPFHQVINLVRDIRERLYGIPYRTAHTHWGLRLKSSVLAGDDHCAIHEARTANLEYYIREHICTRVNNPSVSSGGDYCARHQAQTVSVYNSMSESPYILGLKSIFRQVVITVRDIRPRLVEEADMRGIKVRPHSHLQYTYIYVVQAMDIKAPL